jgi:hypothetical protein
MPYYQYHKNHILKKGEQERRAIVRTKIKLTDIKEDLQDPPIIIFEAARNTRARYISRQEQDWQKSIRGSKSKITYGCVRCAMRMI